jgi:hypothetical protein
MIVFTHRPSPHGWEFGSEVAGLHGSSRTLEKSLDSSEHAARYYLSRRKGYAVRLEDVCDEVDHVIQGAQSDESLAAQRVARRFAGPLSEH